MIVDFKSYMEFEGTNKVQQEARDQSIEISSNN